MSGNVLISHVQSLNLHRHLVEFGSSDQLGFFEWADVQCLLYDVRSAHWMYNLLGSGVHLRSQVPYLNNICVVRTNSLNSFTMFHWSNNQNLLILQSTVAGFLNMFPFRQQPIKGEGCKTQLTESIGTRNWVPGSEGTTPQMKIVDNSPIPFTWDILGIFLRCRVSPPQELSCSATCADDTPAPWSETHDHSRP